MLLLQRNLMVVVAQLVRVTDCGSVGCGFETRLPPRNLRQKPEVFLLSSSYVTFDHKMD